VTVSGSRKERSDAQFGAALTLESRLDVSELLEDERVVAVAVGMLSSEDGESFIVSSLSGKPACGKGNVNLGSIKR
jgi:hypothetical protein